MIDMHQGTTGNELRGAGSDVLYVVAQQGEVFADLWNLRLVSAVKRQAEINLRFGKLLVQRALGRR